ncbi:transport and Golgi organization protein 1 homolog isoform X1 [Leopardus geoffroyi]|uniref:transport and Golgi organization protein 1 homolog isoform X1 n=1 Tax=Leopardus geoffroyi TaxID=46844 RepID=UPI001E2648CB|nr:transport and Golgi organization protein 1 homolog isoform X1 [Leopardus geoffroyi]
MVQKLFFCILILGYPGYPNTNLVHILAGHFPFGSRVFGILWKLTIITATLPICACLVYLWRVVLAIEPQVYQVNLQQITEKINTVKKENRELAEAISIWEQKINESKIRLQEAERRSNIHSAEALKLKSQDANGQFEDPELRAVMSNNCELEESKKALEDKCNALRSAKAAKEAKVRQLKEKAGILEEFYEERKVAIEKKLDTMNCELAAVKNQMATAEENLKIATEEIHKYKQQIEQRREQLQRAELTFRYQIAVYEKNAQHNWIKTQIWERAMAEERREAAHLKHRLDMMEGKRLLEGYMRQKPMPGRPQTQNPPRREPLADPEAGVAPVSHNNKHSTKNAEKDKGSVDPWGPPLLTGRFCTPYPRGPPMGYRACPPPEPWWPWGPPQTCLPTLHGPFADPEVAPVSENNTDSTKRAKKDKAIMYARGPGPFPGWPCRPYHMDHPSSPAKGCGPPPPPPPTPFGKMT